MGGTVTTILKIMPTVSTVITKKCRGSGQSRWAEIGGERAENRVRGVEAVKVRDQIGGAGAERVIFYY